MRLALIEQVVPMSLHVGVARIGVGAKPLLDVLYDTSESDRNIRAFCHVCYLPEAQVAATIVAAAHVVDLGPAISAHV